MSSFAPHAEAPELLSETGLYQGGEIHPALLPFAPRFELWSDGADKKRWIGLPECELIDTSDVDDWELPVGTRLFKEFSVGGKRIETRLIERVGTGRHDFLFAAYLWDEAESDATRVPLGVENANGTSHDVPSEEDCRRCHGSHPKGGGRPSRALGFSALQLAHEGTATSLAGLHAAGRLSAPHPGEVAVPGDEAAQAALGYLHANCGSCHNASADAVPQVDLDLWLGADVGEVEATAAFITAVGQPNQLFVDQHVSGRIVPGDPAASAVVYRMGERGNNAAMPPLASEVVDRSGVEQVSAWIAGLR